MKTMPVGKWSFFVDVNKGVYPVLSVCIRNRLKKKMAINIAVVGEAGVGKSYIAIDIARIIDKNFTVDQVVFTYKEFMELVVKLPQGKPIVFDEPSYAMGKRDWYKQLNKALVLTMESFRFKIHPLIIPVINLNLLDRSIRSYLIQYMVHVVDRGKAFVYRIKAKQYADGFYRYHLTDLEYNLFDNDKCSEPSCLICKSLHKCNIFRAKYEKKKALTQDARYLEAMTGEEDREMSEKLQNMTDEQLAKALWQYKDLFLKNGKLNANRIRIVSMDKLHLKLAHSRTYKVKEMIEYLFEKEIEE